jgi:hypothetical protein
MRRCGSRASRSGADARGRSVPAGTYFYVLKANGKIAQKRMLLVR